MMEDIRGNKGSHLATMLHEVLHINIDILTITKLRIITRICKTG